VCVGGGGGVREEHGNLQTILWGTMLELSHTDTLGIVCRPTPILVRWPTTPGYCM